MSKQQLAFILICAPIYSIMIILSVSEWYNSLKYAISKLKTFNDYVPLICHIIASIIMISFFAGLILMLLSQW